jgi:hypothetical protein
MILDCQRSKHVVEGPEELPPGDIDSNEYEVTVYNYEALSSEEKNILQNYFGEYRKANLLRGEKGGSSQVAIIGDEDREVLREEFGVDDIINALDNLES